jgi:autoinducer 2-degrading protein
LQRSRKETAMYVTLVHVHVTPEHVADFISATRANHESSVKEPGNLRFDVLQSPEDPAYFLLYEAYRTAADAAAHKETAHYRRWRDAVADWMAEPRQGIPFTGLFPDSGR